MLDVDSRRIRITHPDKPLYPQDGITKRDVVRYYEDVADVMVPHLRDRPLHLQRFPDGIDGKMLQQKQVPGYFPEWVGRAQVERKRGGSLTQVVCDDAATLVYLAGQAVLTPHPWLSTRTSPTNPDTLMFDLDPHDGSADAVVDAAHMLRENLEALGLRAAAKTTGSRGIHVVVPLDGSESFERVRGFARRLAEALVGRDPDRFTVEERKEKRGGRVLLDTVRNSYAQTAVAPYALRPLPGAPVAVPLEWREIGRGFDARRHTLSSVRRRLDSVGDPWADLRRHARPLGPAARRLEEQAGP